MQRRHVLIALGLVPALAACGRIRDSRLNPFNWFGRSEEVATVPVVQEGDETRALVQQVLTMQVEETPGGAIVRATGLPPTQGWWEAELVPQPLDEEGRLVLDFRIAPPETRSAVSTQRSREVVVALFLSNFKLAPVREILVQGEMNARAARR